MAGVERWRPRRRATVSIRRAGRTDVTPAARSAACLSVAAACSTYVWRKTVSDVLNEAGLSSTAIERHYRNPRKANLETAVALESMMTEEEFDGEG